jgi:preprotein translocase subunit SecG
MSIESALKFIQILIAVGLVALILLQARGSGGLGSLFGGSSGGAITKTRRGLELTLFRLTIILSVLFIGNAILQLLLQ